MRYALRSAIFRSAVLLSLAASMIAVSCGGDNDVADGDDLQGATGGGLNGTGGGLIGQGGAVNGVACTSANDCLEGEICHPAAQVCVHPGGSCETQEDCATGESCDIATSICLPGLTGSPCASADDCSMGLSCEDSICGCSGFSQEQDQTAGPLDIFFVFDHTSSMGDPCTYTHGDNPPDDSKACYAQYAVNDYLIDVKPATDTRLAFDFMSYYEDDIGSKCDGSVYEDPLVGLTSLPVAENSEIVTAISNEEFAQGPGTRIEDALNGIATFTTAAKSDGREMIGVLLTDGDPSEDCNADIGDLADIISAHLEATGIRTFIIGMEGATNENLEQLAIAGGAAPHDDYCGDVPAPCHYWNVGTGSGAAIADALQAIAKQATPLPCTYALADVKPTDGKTLDLSTLNVRLTETDGTSTVIARVDTEADCPTDQPAWYYDKLSGPTSVNLCQNACDLVTAADAGTKVNITGGCQATVIYK